MGDPAAPGTTGGPGGPRRGPGLLPLANVGLAVALVAVVVGPRLVRRPGGAESPAAVPPVSVAPAALPSAPVPDEETRQWVVAGSPRPEPPGSRALEPIPVRRVDTVGHPGSNREGCPEPGAPTQASPDPGDRPARARCLSRLGRDAYRAGRPAAAAEHYQAAVDALPTDPALRSALVVAWLGAGQPERAETLLHEALGLFPGDPELTYLLAESLERQGRTAAAVRTLQGLLASHPGHARGQSLLDRLQREQAVEASYWTEESAHFVVRHEDGSGLDVARAVLEALEQAYDALGEDLDAHPPGRLQVGIYRAQVMGSVLGVPAHYVRGAYDGRKLRLNLAESVAFSNDLTRLVRHEYAHVLIHQLTRGRAPVWVHEGLAQALEPRPAPRLLDVQVPRELVTLSGIDRLSRTMEPAAFTAGYQLTHVAAQHLLTRGGLAGVRAFLRRLGSGEAVDAALQGAFGFGVGEVEARLLAVTGRG